MHHSVQLNDVEKKLIQQAIYRHRRIFPCGNREQLNDCFTKDEGNLLFWFNTEDHSTHVIMSEVAA